MIKYICHSEQPSGVTLAPALQVQVKVPHFAREILRCAQDDIILMSFKSDTPDKMGIDDDKHPCYTFRP